MKKSNRCQEYSRALLTLKFLASKQFRNSKKSDIIYVSTKKRSFINFTYFGINEVQKCSISIKSILGLLEIQVKNLNAIITLITMEKQSKPSSFIANFHAILSNQEYSSVIKYEQSKAKIYIIDRDKLQQEILSTYFRHNKLSSFIRQLNLYGFEKVKNSSCLCYTHPRLVKGEKLIDIISKKHLQITQVSPQNAHSNDRKSQKRGEHENYNNSLNQQSKVVYNQRTRQEQLPVSDQGYFSYPCYPPLMLPHYIQPYCFNVSPCPYPCWPPYPSISSHPYQYQISGEKMIFKG